MKGSPQNVRGFQNRLLQIGRRTSEPVEFFELREIVRGLKRELRCLLRQNIRLNVCHASDSGGCVKAPRCEIVDVIRHMVLDARDAMPTGGTLRILTDTVALDAEYARTHPEVPPGDYAMLMVRDTGDQSNAAGPGALGPETGIRKGRGLGLAACYDAIDQFGGHLCVSRHAHETVIKIYLPCAR
jgi:two-component system cell cycle sensor histidine kinase/response regulator CckA